VAYCPVNQTFVNMSDDDDQLCVVALAAAVVTSCGKRWGLLSENVRETFDEDEA